MYPALQRRLTPDRRGAFALLATLLGILPAAAWPATGGEDASARFLAAEEALKGGDRAVYESLLDGLTDYPLYPYLLYADLAAKRDEASDQAIEGYLEQFPGTPMAGRLRSDYLGRLAAQGRWADYARLYRPDDSTERRCLYLRALLETGETTKALAPEAVETLWLVPRSQPDACDPVFAAWGAAGRLTTDLVWGRIRLAMEAGEQGLARRLGRRLPESERPWLERWLTVAARPDAVLESGPFPGDHPMGPALLAQGIGRLAAADPRKAAEVLEAQGEVLVRDPAARDSAHRAVARALLRSGLESDVARALVVWDPISTGVGNLEAQEERVRAAIRLGDWERVAHWIGLMPEGDEKADRWLYWQGRAQAALGLPEAAAASFAEAAERRSLWGFLAADRLGLPYRLDPSPVPARPEWIERLEADPALARIHELRRLGRHADMRREWRALTRDLDADGLMAAAALADRLGWHDQAIFTLARTGYWDDLSLRFPLRYRDLIEEQAWQTGLGEDWIFAVLRQESVFAPDVASSAGALGLMQLMPATARQVAQALAPSRPRPGRAEILDPQLNIALGSAYLAWMRDRFGHVALATAAYNAGPHRVTRWLPEDCTEADLWILSIPFQETRGYVERVLAYRIIYGDRLGLEPVRISELLPPVRGKRDE